MARNKFRGDSLPVAQVSQFPITLAGGATDTVTVNISNKYVTAVAGASPTTTTIAAAVATACANSQITEFLEITWTSIGPTVYATASTAGVPFILGTIAVTGTTTVGAVTTPTASSGPHHWDDPTNWSLGIIPISTHDVDIQDVSVDILYGIAQSAVTLNSLNIYSTFTGKIGLIPYNGNYYEYRNTDLQISATTVQIGAGQGSGSSMIRLNTGSVATAMQIWATSTASLQGTPAIWWTGTNASNTLSVTRGSVGLAYQLGTTAQLSSLQIGSQGGSSDSQVYGGVGLTLATLAQVSGSAYLLNGMTTITTDGGTLTLAGTSMAITTLTGRGGTINFDGTGTVTNTVLGNAFLDLSRDPRSGKTFTNLTLNAGAGLNDPNKVATFTNPIALTCHLKDISPLELGDILNIARS